MGMKRLFNRKLVSVTGEGAIPFLQGLAAQDMTLLTSKKAVGAIFLNPKGRLLCDAIVVRTDDGVMLDVPAAHHEMMATMLTRHKLRLPVQVDKMTELAVHYVTHGSGDLGQDVVAFSDPRSSYLPERCLVPSPPDNGDDLTEALDYRKERLMAGIVEANDMPADSIPIFYNFDLFNCVSFNKGCYTGQELVTRTLRRGIVRKRAVPLVRADGVDVVVGQKVSINGVDVGTVFAACGNVGQAVVQMGDQLNEKAQFCAAIAKIDQVTLDGTAAKILIPKYCIG